MTATTLHFGVTDLALEKVRSMNGRISRFSRIFLKLVRFHAFVTRITVRRNAQTKRLANLAVWFQGAKTVLAQERTDGKVHAPEELIKGLERLERILIEGRESDLDFVRNSSTAMGISSPYVEAVRAHLAAAADLYEAISSFKWAAMEADADAEIASGKVKYFNSASDLFADLNS